MGAAGGFHVIGRGSCLRLLVPPAYMAEQLHAHGATAEHVAAVLRELVGARVKPRIVSVEGPWQALERGARQGAVGSPESATMGPPTWKPTSLPPPAHG